MPNSCYYKIAGKISEWLDSLQDTKIKCNASLLIKKLMNFKMKPDRTLVSFDVTSLYTNVPVIEAIHLAAERLYQLEDGKPEVEKEVLIELAKLACSNVIMSTPNGYHKQIDGLAMGSQPAPQLANLWLSQFEDDIKDKV